MVLLAYLLTYGMEIKDKPREFFVVRVRGY